MMKSLFLMCVLGATGCLMEDLPLQDLPDAEPPTEEVDATPSPMEPDATVPVTTPDAGNTPECDAATPATPDATVPETPDAAVPPTVDASVPSPDAAVPPTPDAATVPPPDASPPDATPPPTPVDAATPDAVCPACDDDADCDDGWGWTNDSCSGGTCVYTLADCGGMQIWPSESAVNCVFWGGFEIAEPAPPLGTYPPESLYDGLAGDPWKAAPASSCSVECYSSGGNRVAIDCQIEWSGVESTFYHAVYYDMFKCTYDGRNME